MSNSNIKHVILLSGSLTYDDVLEGVPFDKPELVDNLDFDFFLLLLSLSLYPSSTFL